MENAFDKLQSLIVEIQSQKNLDGCYIILADKSKAEESNGQLICAVHGKRNQLMDMIMGAIKADPALKKMILDVFMLDAISGVLGKRMPEKECKCDSEGCRCDNTEKPDCTCTEGCGPGTCEE